MAIKRWLLPDGIEELLPREARQLEHWRRKLIDVYESWGYELVVPPLVEYLDSLLIGTGTDLEQDTFKVIDQQSGRILGIRADITPQVARIDAHRLQENKPQRFCYVGNVLRARSRHAQNRSPMQMGAELYGCGSASADFEIIAMMLDCLRQLGLGNLAVDIGHVGIFRAIAAAAQLDEAVEQKLFAALQRKSIPDIKQLVREKNIESAYADAFEFLAGCHGGRQVISEAKSRLKFKHIDGHLAALEQLAEKLEYHLGSIAVHYDLAELRGYNYHTGIVFAAYVPGMGQEIAKGGRYDNIGAKFGRGRTATGFSGDLKAILSMVESSIESRLGILAPIYEQSQWMEQVSELRAKGERVIFAQPDEEGMAEQLGCDRILRFQDNQWVLEKIER